MCFGRGVRQQESMDASGQEIKEDAIRTKECFVKFENLGSDSTVMDHLLHLYLLMFVCCGICWWFFSFLYKSVCC